MLSLRPYQNDAVAGLRGHFSAGHKRVVLCLPTGSGKTVVFSYLVKATITKNPRAKVLILTDRVELLAQAGGTLGKLGIEWAQIASGLTLNHYANVYVGMVETFFRRIQKFPHLLDMNLVIIDEAHRGNFKKLFSLFKPETFVIGATATPLASSQKDPLINYYQAIVNTVSIPDLIEEGFLVPAETYAAKVDTSKLKTDNMGEYTNESQMEVFAKREVYDGVVNKYLALGSGKKAVCFNVNIDHSIEVTRRFLEAGINAEHLDGETPIEQRKAILARFKSGETAVLCNVGIVTTGFDEPSVEIVIINRATTSVPLWLQMCGRGSRLCPEIGKQKFIIIDMGENWRYLGLWEHERDWEDMFYNPVKKKKKSEKKQAAPVKDCPQCEAILSLSARDCPHCGHEFEAPKPNIVEEVEFDMVNVKPRDWDNLNLEQLLKLQITKGYKVGWVLHQLRNRSLKPEKYREIESIKDRDPETYAFRVELIRRLEREAYEKNLRALSEYKGYKRGWVKREMQNFQTSY